MPWVADNQSGDFYRHVCEGIKFWVERANSRIEIFVGLILVVQLRDIVLANFIRYENLGRHPARTHYGNYVDLALACVDWCGCRVHHMSLCEKFNIDVILADYVEGYVHDSKTV